METQEQGQYQNQGYSVSNLPYLTASALQIRLDLSQEIIEFQKYILGIEVYYEQTPDGPQEKIKRVGSKLVNDLGFQAFIGWITFVVNKHTMMGNFITENDYNKYLCDLHKDVWCDLVINRNEYGIDLRQLPALHAKFMMCARLVLTRPIFDKERQGMNVTTKIEERSQTSQTSKAGMFSGFFGGRK